MSQCPITIELQQKCDRICQVSDGKRFCPTRTFDPMKNRTIPIMNNYIEQTEKCTRNHFPKRA